MTIEKNVQVNNFFFLYSNLLYPASARENNTEELDYVQFIVEKNGMLDSIRILKDIGDGCGDAVVSTIEKMNDFNPPFVSGKQLDKAVRVHYNLPITFKLEGRRKRKKR
ncbi:MAG: energy transducer TonB [Saprospiraceae bacterium]